MSNIKRMKDKDGNYIYPVTHASAVFDSEGNTIEDTLYSINASVERLNDADIPMYNLRNITKELGVTQGIQKVFDEVGETGIGRILLDKVYEIDEPLILNRTNKNTNTSIEIYGGGCLKKSSNFVGDQLILLKIGYHDEDNIIFNNISFDGVDRSCNAVDNFSNLSFDSECSDSKTNNMSKFVKFYNCSFNNCYHGVRLSSLSYVFSGCLFTSNNYGVYLDCSANANIFMGCSMRRNVIGIKIKQFSSTIGSISNGFYNCTIESNTNLGVLSKASRNSKIIGCYFENNGFSINPDFENFDGKKVHIWLDDKGGAGMHTIDSFFNTSNFDIVGRFINSVILNKCSLCVEYASESTFINVPLSKITFIGMSGYSSSFNSNGVEYISDKNTQKLYKKDEFNNSLVFRTKNYGLYERETVDKNSQSIELATLTVSNFQGAILNFNSMLFGLTANKNQISCGAIKGRIMISKATNGEEEYIAHIDDLKLLNCEGASSGAGEGLTTLGLFAENASISATTNNNTIILTLNNIKIDTLTNWGKLYYIQKAITANFELVNSNSYEINTEFLTLS